MSLFRYPGSKVWWYDFRFQGRRYRASTKSRSKTVAAEAEHARRRDLEQGFNRISTAAAPKTFAASAQGWLELKKLTLSPRTYRSEAWHVKRLIKVFGTRLITDFHPEDVKKYQEGRQSDGAAPKTVNLEVSTLRSVLIRNRAWSAIQPDVHMLRVPEELGYALSEEAEGQLLEACTRSRGRYLYTLATVALCTCLRSSELRLLQWKQVDLTNQVLLVGLSKTPHGTHRRIPLNARAMSTLQQWASHFPDRSPEHYVFPSERYFPKAQVYETSPEKPISFQSAWRRAKKRANLELRFHDLRHTGCSRMLEGGMSFPIVARIMGWSPAMAVLMARRYGHFDKSLKEAVALLNGPRKADGLDKKRERRRPRPTKKRRLDE